MFSIGQTVRCTDDTGLTSYFLVEGDDYTITWLSDLFTALKVEGSDTKFKASRFEEIDSELEAFEDRQIFYEAHSESGDIGCCQVEFINFHDNSVFNKYAYENVIGYVVNIGICALRETQQPIIDAILERGWVEFGVPSQSQQNLPGHSLRTFVINKKPLEVAAATQDEV